MSSIKLAGVILRRKSTSQDLGGGYDPQDYQVLLRYWLVEPYQRHLAVFSGPLIPSEDPAETLLQQCYNWNKKLGDSAGHPELKGIRGELADVALSLARGPDNFRAKVVRPHKTCCPHHALFL